MAREIPVTQARSELAELVNRVAYSGERVVLTRHGKPLAALVSADDLERLEPSGEIGFSRAASVERAEPQPRQQQQGNPLRIAAEHRQDPGFGR